LLFPTVDEADLACSRARHGGDTDRESKRPAEALAHTITRECLRRGLFLAATLQPGRYWAWRVAPPLTISHAEIDRALEIIEAASRAVVGGS
jgi:2,2-dialkylglycine decarboxylase (pyruvate)